MEGLDPGEAGDGGDPRRERNWFLLSRTPSVSGSGHRRSDLRLLLGVMGAPLAPIHVSYGEPLPHLSIKDTPIVRALLIFFFFFFLVARYLFVKMTEKGFLFNWVIVA